MPNYLSADHEVVYRNEAGYEVEDGIVVDAADKRPGPFTRAANAHFNFPSAEQKKIKRLAEDVQWAARSGPVYIINRGAKA